MKNYKLRGRGGSTLIAFVAGLCLLAGTQQAFADEAVSQGQGQGEVAIFDGPGLLPPTDSALPSEPPREGMPGPTPPREELAIANPILEPNPAPANPPRESPSRTPEALLLQPEAAPSENSVQTASPAEIVTPSPAEVAVTISMPTVLAATAMTYTLRLPAGSKVITPSVKATLAKTAVAVKKSGRPASIAVKTLGTTLAKATAQANAIVAELKKRGVSAVTVIKRVGKKTSVSVLVTKKRP